MEAARAARAGRRENLSLKLAPRARRQKESFDAAFEGFYREHVAEVYQYALAVLSNSADAEDVTQQTFLNAYRAFQRGERPHKAHNWLIKIAHNVCRMRWRQSGRRPQEVPLERAAEPTAPDDEKPSLDEVLNALAKLPFNQRSAIVMREVEDRSYAEIAEVLGVTVPAVEALLFRARGNLRERRKALSGALSVAPVPASLSSFVGSGSGGLIAAGGAALGSQLALKVVAAVATGIVAGGLGFKAVGAVATPEPAATPLAQQHGQGRAFVPSMRKGAGVDAGHGSVDASAFRHPSRAASRHGALESAPTNDQPSDNVRSEAESAKSAESPESPQPAGNSSVISTISTSPTDTVRGVATSVPSVPAVPSVPVPSVTTTPPTSATVTTPVTSVTVTVPTVTLPLP
jgi:RNA polymerase sigma-70 factor (ECF subfamily)